MDATFEDPRYSLKVELKSLTLSDDMKRQVQDTLKFLHGEEFVHKELSAYKDRKLKLDRQYWRDRGNLIVHGGQSNAKKDIDSNLSDDKINHFAISKLEKYGFFKPHCIEALNASNGDVGSAYEILMCRYFNLVPSEVKEVPVNLLEERTQELDSLRSIYDQCCEERLPNVLWVFHLNLPYLGEVYMKRRQTSRNLGRKKNKNICRFFAKGNCRFGNNCRFSHEPVVEEPVSATLDKDQKHIFELEVRFPMGCQYPLEVPLVSLISKSSDFPANTCLRITHRLMCEAHKSMKLQQPCIFILVDLLCNRQEEILNLLKGPNPIFYDPSLSLFPVASPDGQLANGQNENDVDFMYSSSEPSKKSGPSLQTIERIDNELANRYQTMCNNPKFNAILNRRKNLPAWSKKVELLDTINKNQVVIISGETGCGKSTQIPQFILDDWLSSRSNKHTEIICTQPRRISAIGVAERVASERLERIGDSIGYQIRLETRSSNHTRVTFCTTGILLRKLESDPHMKSVTHVIVDEVHERSVESDFILLILKDLLTIRTDLKVILMSATINSHLFKEYFNDAPTIEIPGRTFPVEQLFLEDIILRTNYTLEEYSEFSRKIAKQQSRELEILDECDDLKTVSVKGMLIPNLDTQDEFLPVKQVYYRYWSHSKNVCKTIFLTDTLRVNLELIETVLEYIVTGDHKYPREGAILVFLPGIGEIKEMMARLEANPLFCNSNEFKLIPLHSTLTNEEQSEVFRKPRHGERKIVLSTNIAETSITIDDCVFVIDSGKMKEKGFDSNRNMESLEMVTISKANAQQRKGRAGRVMPGVCFHLFTKHRFEYVLEPQPVPEIRRVPLEALILRIKTLPNFENKQLEPVINNIIEPPSMENVEGAVKRLKNIGALDEQANVTPLGKHLASLPVDVRIGKLLLYGAMFCALDSALTIAAFLSYKTPFITHIRKREDIDIKRKKFVTGFSDHLTTLNAYKGWLKAIETKGMRGGVSFAKVNYLSTRTLSTLADMKLQYLELLGDIGFVPGNLEIVRRPGVDRIFHMTGPELNVNGENQKLLASILCASLYPNIVKILTPTKTFQESIAGAVPQPLRPEELVFKTKTDGYVSIHPTSVNSNVSNYPSPYLVYQEKVKTGKIYIRDCTMVPILPLVLFSAGKIKVELNCDEFFISLDDGWIIFPVPSNETAELLETIKSELLMLLDEKIKEPKMNLQKHPKGKKIISTIVDLVTSCY
ncbi:putative ATP-dependent RNA helicase DHX57 [Cimex lectularius]|uniref:Putative ATP-dependent RNA helicase DHX57 n=1 Tax=Cimex lectularius TaxID=79782 RepID=A0A8I6RWK4_CIMLE|nr:putative ATP-dependent RNA helicase DHX57 [Cimex lectularius]